MTDSVEKRVAQWSKMAPFYSDEKFGKGKAVTSRATEAVLNAVVLASYDIRQGHLRTITRTAFDNAWALQQTTGDLSGGWLWQDFHLGTLGIARVRISGRGAPHDPGPQCARRLRPRARGFAKISPSSAEYIRRKYAVQPLMNQLYILWASAKDPSLLSTEDRPGARRQNPIRAAAGRRMANRHHRPSRTRRPLPRAHRKRRLRDRPRRPRPGRIRYARNGRDAPARPPLANRTPATRWNLASRFHQQAARSEERSSALHDRRRDRLRRSGPRKSPLEIFRYRYCTKVHARLAFFLRKGQHNLRQKVHGKSP